MPVRPTIQAPSDRFDRTVPVQVTPNRIRMVGSAKEAAETLLYRWPGTIDTRKHLAARKACLAVLEGVGEARKARAAFEAAAKEAGIFADGVRR